MHLIEHYNLALLSVFFIETINSVFTTLDKVTQKSFFSCWYSMLYMTLYSTIIKEFSFLKWLQVKNAWNNQVKYFLEVLQN